MKIAFIRLACWEACGAFSSLMSGVGGHLSVGGVTTGHVVLG